MSPSPRLRLLLPLALALAVAAPACGGDDDDHGDDDHAPAIDAGDDGDEADAGGDGAPAYQSLTCDGDPDAMVPAGALPDAGAPDGTGEPCCDPTGACGFGLTCVEKTSDGSRTCRPNCELDAAEPCPGGGVCADFGGMGICVEGAGEGDPCAPEFCTPGTTCVGSSAEDATCHRVCDAAEDCDDGQTCTDLNGGGKACL